jgi:hypothetical protein
MRRHVFWLFGGVVIWMKKKQYVVTFFIVELEYMESTHAYKEVIRLLKLCSKLGLS